MEKSNALPFEQQYEHLKGVIERFVFYKTGTKRDVEDIAQEMFLKLWQKWPRLCELSEVALEDYLYVMVKNHLSNQYRKIVRARKYHKYVETSISECCWHDEVILAEGFKVYDEAVGRLSPREKTVYLFYENNCHRNEIAVTVQRSEHTVKNQLRSASQAVKKYLNKKFDLNIRKDGRRKMWGVGALN